VSPALVIILVGSLVAASCALVGSFLVLRKMALLGDAISHAVLPGIVLAFLWTGDRSALPMVLGAGALGLATVALVELFHRSRRLTEDASIGVVFPALFSLGGILVSRYAAQVDLDLDCVLYGEIAYTPWDLWLLGERSLGPKALWVGAGVLLFDLAVVLLFYKELKIATFDPELAGALGFSPVLLHYLLMGAVSVTVVGAFESVGAILVVAMLVVPPATAYLFTDRLSRMIGLAVGLGVASAVLGYLAARWWDASIAGAMATVAGLLFLAGLAVAPGHGLVARMLRHARLRRRLSGRLVLLHMDHRDHEGHEGVSRELLERRFGWSARRTARTLASLEAQGWIEQRDSTLVLTEAGHSQAHAAGAPELGHPLSLRATPSAAAES
jgi:manganese/zinc/iron transport system permease protein